MDKIDINNLPESITTTLYVYLYVSGYLTGHLMFFDSKTGANDRILIAQHEVTIPINKKDATINAIAVLQEEIAKEQTTSQAKVQALQAKISQYQGA